MATRRSPPAAKKAAAAKKSTKPRAKPSAADTAAAAARAAATRARKYAEEARQAAEEAKAAAAAAGKPRPRSKRDPSPAPWQNLVPVIQDGQVGVEVNGTWIALEAWLQQAGSLRLVIGLHPAATDPPEQRTLMTQSLSQVMQFLAKNDRFLRFVAQCQSEAGTCPDSD